jgi:hypothetical protein
MLVSSSSNVLGRGGLLTGLAGWTLRHLAMPAYRVEFPGSSYRTSTVLNNSCTVSLRLVVSA